jgi:hypothetical protein
MINFYKIAELHFKTEKKQKNILHLVFAFFMIVQVNAQVSLYTFAQGNETYSEITGGTILELVLQNTTKETVIYC